MAAAGSERKRWMLVSRTTRISFVGLLFGAAFGADLADGLVKRCAGFHRVRRRHCAPGQPTRSIASLPLAWLTAHLQLIGYFGRELLVANYWRETQVPFDRVAAVEPVWWYRGRFVRIRFNTRAPFGSTVLLQPPRRGAQIPSSGVSSTGLE